MKYLITLLVLMQIIVSPLFSQKLESGQLVQMEVHKEEGILIARIYSKQKRICDIWELKTYIPSLKISDYNKHVDEGNLVPHGQHIHYSSNMKLEYKENYLEGKLNGKYESFYPSGKTHISCSFFENSLDGTFNEYTKDRVLIFTTHFTNARKNGIEKAYFPNGNDKYSCKYTYGKLDGQVKAFYENGNIKQKATYERGKPTKQKCFDANKNKIACQPCVTSLDYPDGIKTFIAELYDRVVFDSTKLKTEFFFLQFNIDKTGNIKDFKTIPENTGLNTNILKEYTSSIKAFLPPAINEEPQISSLFIKVPTTLNESKLKMPMSHKELFIFDTRESKLRNTENSRCKCDIILKVI